MSRNKLDSFIPFQAVWTSPWIQLDKFISSYRVVGCFFFFIFYSLLDKTFCLQIQMPYSMASDCGLRCLPMSHVH